MKKLLSLILSMAMVFSLTAMSFAADTTYTITINNATPGHTYEAYQIFSGDLSSTGVLSNIKWGSGVKAEGQSALGNVATKAEAIKTTADAEAFAKEVSKYLASPAGSTSEMNNEQYKITGLQPGYYLVKDKDASLAGSNDAYTSYVLKVVKNVTVNPKSSTPTSEKKVIDTNDSTGETTDWQDSADYDIGDKVPFQLKGTVAADYDKYKVYKFTFHDKESTGLTFNNDVKVYVDGTLITDGYRVVASAIDGYTFDVVFDNLKDIPSVHAGSVITVEYTSTLNEKAQLGKPGNPNTMYLEYSNNPNDEQGGETGETPKDTVIVFTYKTIVNKVDGGNNPLTGAEFTLEKKVGNSWIAIKVVKNTEGTQFTFSGLDDGIYRLTETKTPEGYNTIDPIEFEIVAGHDTLADNPTLNSLNGNIVKGEITFTPSVQEGSLSTDVVNKSGTTLPETGGIGTKIFYTVGAILVIGAGVLFVTKRRINAE